MLYEVITNEVGRRENVGHFASDEWIGFIPFAKLVPFGIRYLIDVFRAGLVHHDKAFAQEIDRFGH